MKICRHGHLHVKTHWGGYKSTYAVSPYECDYAEEVEELPDPNDTPMGQDDDWAGAMVDNE